MANTANKRMLLFNEALSQLRSNSLKNGPTHNIMAVQCGIHILDEEHKL